MPRLWGRGTTNHENSYGRPSGRPYVGQATVPAGEPYFRTKDNIDKPLAKVFLVPFSVIPAKAGIQCFQGILDPGFLTGVTAFSYVKKEIF
jgi:hypothetical protein